jgi:small-conductance mechanosensitive channel
VDPFLAISPFQVSGDALTVFIDVLPLIVLIVVLAGFMMWVLGLVGRYFEYLKTIENAWIDQKTLDFVRRVLESVWIAFIAIIILAAAQTQSDVLHSILAAFLLRVPAIFVFVFVLFAAAIVVRVLHRFGAFLRGELKTRPKRVAPAGALAFAETVLKYVIYIVALVIAVLGSLRALPAADQTYIQQTIGVVPGIEPAAVLGIMFGLLAIVVADRFVDSIFEDMKRHNAKFSPRALDELKSVARYAVWILGAVVLLFIILALVLSGDRLIIFAVGFVGLMIALAVVAFAPIESALAGFTLMRADPFDVGHRVKIGEDLVGDVVSMSLSLTTIRTLRNEFVQIPNASLLHTPIVNFSRSKPYAIFVEVSVGFEVGHDRVRTLLLQAASEVEGIVKEHAAEVFGKEIQGGTVLYQLFAYTNQPERMKEIKSALVYRIQDLLTGAGIRTSGPGPGA